LNDLVEKNKNLADASIKSVADISENLSETIKTLANFNEIYEKSRKNAHEAKSTTSSTNENVAKVNSLLQSLKENMQQILADVENVRSKNNILANSMEKMNLVRLRCFWCFGQIGTNSHFLPR
jgi:methyl-accepting chemotaxis protein